MATISLCMIVKNEEQTLKRCLNSAKGFVDEIIIVDTGSTDNTKKIARQFTDKVLDFVWCDDFSKARNFSFSFASKDYILWLDADDVVPTKTINYLKKNKPSLNQDVYMLKYNIAFKENKPTFSYYRERLIKNCNKAVWQGVVHECITPFGKVTKLPLAINHKKIAFEKSNRNLKIYENTLKNRELSPREQYYYGRELYDHKKFKKCISVLNKFINDGNGWVENAIDALFILHFCYKNINDTQNALTCLLKTFALGFPRPKICYYIAEHFFLQKNYQTAIFWYKLATTCTYQIENGGFCEPLYKTYYPLLQLSCCYYYLNDIKNAIKYNNTAGKYFNSDAVKSNKIFYENYLKNSTKNTLKI